VAGAAVVNVDASGGVGAVAGVVAGAVVRGGLVAGLVITKVLASGGVGAVAGVVAGAVV